MNPCNPNPCMNDGVCFANGLDYTCRCPETHEGEHCEDKGTSSITRDMYVAFYVACLRGSIWMHFVHRP